MARPAHFLFVLVTLLFGAIALSQGGCGTDQASIPSDTSDGGAGNDGALGADAAGGTCGKDSDCATGNLCIAQRCAPGCHSTRDCPSSKHVCDPSAGPNGACIECIAQSDCPAGDVCLGGACAKSCNVESDCPGQHCNTALHACVDCVSKDQCPIGNVCASSHCITGCDGDRDCPTSSPKCNASATPHGACVQCLAPSDCGAGYDCANNACVKQCTGESDCPGQHCDTVTKRCVQCTSTSQCALGNVCKSDACTPGCAGDRDCPTTSPRCLASTPPNGKCVQCTSPADCNGAACVNNACQAPTGAPLVNIPGGSFVMGSSVNQFDGGTNDTQPHTVTLGAYAIDKLEVTNDVYGACVKANACAAPTTPTDFNDATKKSQPVTFVTWDMANQFCQWAGRRLPTEAEWEYAARGGDGRTYPWGEATPSCTMVNGSVNAGNTCVGALTDVGTHPTGASPFGVQDLAGNAREWVEDWYAAYGAFGATDPHGPSGGIEKLARGGSWASLAVDLTAYTRPTRTEGSNDAYIGFRCAKSPGGASARFMVSPGAGLEGQTTFAVDASGSSDTIDASSLLSVRWDWNDDGVWDTSWSPAKTAEHVFATAGTYTVALEVQNTRGEVERALRVVSVAPVLGGDGTVCVGDAGAACASNYTCVTTQGVCRQSCTGPGDTSCAKPGSTCQQNPDIPFPGFYVCF